jgi:peroxin-7
MTVNVWDLASPNPLINRLDHHTEFVLGIDFNIFIDGQLGTCSWDERGAIFDMREHVFPPPPQMP